MTNETEMFGRSRLQSAIAASSRVRLSNMYFQSNSIKFVLPDHSAIIINKIAFTAVLYILPIVSNPIPVSQRDINSAE